MPADERIKVIFKRVEIVHDGDWIGSGEWYFTADVEGVHLEREGRPTTSVRDGGSIDLDQDFWNVVVGVRNKTRVRVTFEAFDKDLTSSDHMGSFSWTLHRNQAWRQIELVSRLENYTLIWEVQLSVGGAFGRHPAASVFATRTNTAGGVNFSTVTGNWRASRLEICPVWPVPPDADLPTRPPPAGIIPYRNGNHKDVVVGDPINVIPNPEVVPLLSDPAPAVGVAPALPAGAPPRATATTAARIETTYYYPTTLNFADDDPRLEWEANPAGRIGFVGGNTGLKVLVYGKSEGDVVLTVKFQGADFARYRAVVRRVRRITYRANILNGPGASKPRSGPQHVPDHVAIANMYLRQACLELVPDTNVSATHGAVSTGNGTFRINGVTTARTRNVTGSTPFSSRMNYRNGVLNIQYVHSIQSPAGVPPGAITGRGTDRPRNPAAPQITDNLVPTPSWLRPTAADGGGNCGVPPAPNPGGPVRMSLLPASTRAGFNGAGQPVLAALLITNRCGDPADAARIRVYGNVLAHELGHVLGLAHRIPIDDGTVGFPARENMLCQGAAFVRQDFDRAQSQIMRQSPILLP